ncbi:MAG: hypothetical protein J6B95_04035 [Oscillospiraceae bacterium]|nr:hypothetical protein [Oscillospiraceae bacterium]
MQNRELTPAQKEYRRFDTRRGIIIKTLIVFLVAILVCFVAAFQVVDKTRTPLWGSLGMLIMYTIITIFVCTHLARKHGQLYFAAFGNDTDIICTGLFGEIWQEFEWNQFEGLTDGKVIFAENLNKTIELQILRKTMNFIFASIAKQSICFAMRKPARLSKKKSLFLISRMLVKCFLQLENSLNPIHTVENMLKWRRGI